MNRTEKEQIVADLHQQFVAVQGAVLTDFTRLNVREITAIRKAFREAGVSFRVVKNTLARQAAQSTPLEVLSKDFIGTTAIAYCMHDVAQAARVANKCAKDQEKFVIKCGYVEGGRLNPQEVQDLAKLPSQAELRAKLLGMLNAPAASLVRVLNAVPQKMLQVLSAYEKKLNAQE